MQKFIMCMMVLLGCMNVTAAPVQWSSGVGANGHFYEAFIVPGGITWDDARSAAITAGGDLATITSSQENNFVFGLIDNSAYWTHPGGWYGPWLGGYQTPQASVPTQDPAADWKWVTGDAWAYTVWAQYEPNDSSGLEEDRLEYHAPYDSNTWGPTWADTKGNNIDLPISYIVETVPEPGTITLLLAGVISLFAYAWQRRKPAA